MKGRHDIRFRIEGGIHIAELKTRKAVERKKAQVSAITAGKQKVNPASRAAAIAKAKDAVTQRREDERQDAARSVEQVEEAAQYLAYEAGHAMKGTMHTRTQSSVHRSAETSGDTRAYTPNNPLAPQEAVRTKAVSEAAKAAQQAPQFPVVEFPDFDPYADLPSVPNTAQATKPTPPVNPTPHHERSPSDIKTPSAKAPYIAAPATKPQPQEVAKRHAVTEAKRGSRDKWQGPARDPATTQNTPQLLHERRTPEVKAPRAKTQTPAVPIEPQAAARQHAVVEAKRDLQTKQQTSALYPSVHPSIHPSEASDLPPGPIEPPALFHEKPAQEIKTPPPKADAKPTDTAPPGQQAGRQALIQKIKREKAQEAAALRTSTEAPPITPIMVSPPTTETAARTLNRPQTIAQTPPTDLASAPALEGMTLKTRRRAEPAIKLKDNSRAAAIKTKGSATAPQLPAAPVTIKAPTAVNAAAQTEAKRNILRIRRQGKELAIKQLTASDKRISKRLILAAGKLAKAAGKAVKDLLSALVSYCGGTVLIIVLCAVILVGALVSSPMGVLFSDEASGDDGVSLTSAIGQISSEYSAQLRSLRAGYDSFSIVGHAPKWKDVIAVYACQTAGRDDGTEVLTLDAEHIQKMKDVFWDMTEITSTTSTIFHEDTDTEDEVDDSWTESEITITVTAKTAADMEDEYRFSHYQRESMEVLLLELDEWDLFAIDLDISDATALSVWENLPDDLSPERRLVVQYALSLCGKVTYFWGGKSLVLGTDPRWGQSTQVWAAGSPTTGTYRPFGLDCSGFVDWAFYNASEGTYIIGRGGGVIAQHNNCRSISWSEAIPGDLVFYPGDSHIGIVVGWTSGGSILICHCASGSQNGVYVTGRVGFTSVGRPYYYSD